ncbi:Caspase domain containing protein [Paracoccaceae bacterium]
MSLRGALIMLALLTSQPVQAGLLGLEPTDEVFPSELFSGVTDRLVLPDLPAQVCRDEAPVTRALLVGVAESVPDFLLKGPQNDVEILRNALIAKGAKAENLTVHKDPEATRPAFEAAFVELLSAANCGDSVILQFTGHSIANDPRGPWFLMHPTKTGRTDLLSADAIAAGVAALRDRGANVSVILDVMYAETYAIGDRQPDGTLRYQLSGSDDARAPRALGPLTGDLSVFYAADDAGEAGEKRLPRGGDDRTTYGIFSFYLAAALMEVDLSTPAALMRSLRDNKALATDRGSFGANDFVFTTTNPDLRIVAEQGGGKDAPKSGSTDEVIRILSPEPTRSAAPLDTQSIVLEGRVESGARTLIVLVNGQEAEFDPDGFFRFPLDLQAGVNAIKVLALTETNRPITADLELYYEGDMQALLGTGKRYALLIANEDYPKEAGLADLKTPLGDAEALEAVLTADFGYTTSATSADGQKLDLFLKNPTRLEVETALYELGRIAGEKDSVLIFYAGHGVYEEATGKAYWLHADAAMGRPFSWLSADAISDAILRINAGSLLVISDSCYSGALLRGGDLAGLEGRIDDKDRLLQLQRTAAKRSRILLTSGGNEPVLDGGGSGHSVFAAALLTGLREMDQEAFTTAELYADYLLPLVVGKAAQEPQFRPVERSGHEGGDVVWVRQPE